MARERIARIALTATSSTTAGAVMSWANPFGADIVITRAMVILTTVSTGAAALDIGVAADATTNNDTMFDGLDVNGGGTGAFDNNNDTHNGSNGVSLNTTPKVMTSTQYLNAKGSATTAGMVGYMYVWWMPK